MPFIAFDLQGTLCSYDPVIEQVKEILGRYTKTDLTIELAKSFFDQWYSEAVRDYIATSQAGDYCPLRKVLEATLERTLLCFSEQVELTTQKVELRLIMTAFDKVELVSEWPEVLTLFQKEDAQWDVLILSNGNTEETKQLLQNKMILSNVNVNIICCDDLQLTKPHPKVYSELMKLAVHNTKRIENFYMVSSHAYELASAKNVAMRTVFLNTTERVYAAQMYRTGEPDIVGSSLIDCAKKVIDFEKAKKNYVQPLLTKDAMITIENV